MKITCEDRTSPSRKFFAELFYKKATKSQRKLTPKLTLKPTLLTNRMRDLIKLFDLIGAFLTDILHFSYLFGRESVEVSVL